MISINILFTKKDEAERILDALLEENLIYGGYLQNIDKWKRKKELPKYNFSVVLIALTRAIAYSNLISFIDKKFSTSEYLAYTNPVLNISGTHEEQLKKYIP